MSQNESYPLIINKNNLVDGTTNTYEYNFGQNVDLSNILIGLGSITLNYAWPNITAQKQNNQFQIIHPATGATNDTLTITLPDGGYEISDINDYLRWYLINNGYYIQDNTTREQTVYCEFQVNPSLYVVEFISYPLPTSLPAGFTAGSAITFPSTTRAPQLVIAQPNFGKVIGFATGTFNPVQQTILNTSVSTLVPQVSDVSNVLITCDAVNNQFSLNNKVVYSLSPQGVAYGGIVNSIPPQIAYVRCQGFRQTITIQLCDQNGLPLNLIDTDITIRLILKLREQETYL